MSRLSKEEKEARAEKYLEDLQKIQPAVEVIDGFIQEHLYELDPKCIAAWLDIRKQLKIGGPVEVKI